MSVLTDLLASAPVVADGALGTELQARGLASGELPDEWNLSHPDVIEDVIRSYVNAGSEVVLTATFRANRVTLAGHGLEDKVTEINRTGIEIARRAAAGRARVFASVGPTGKLLMMGDVTAGEARAAFAEQCRAIADAGADAILLETMTDLEEAKIAVAAARETGLPVGCSMVFDTGKKKDRTMMGATPESVAAELEAAGVDFIGANCGVGIQGYIEVCRRLRAATAKPLWIKANAGLPEMVDGKAVYRTTPEEFASSIPALIEAGANFVGGCCGTNPDFIRATAAVVAKTKAAAK
ncbi:MAG TPA: homocysteine S-methyltransferase family protein [Bryobacteraceae bacterium]|nr:homocysteine S-methyltransferase family protein [Bryobacteraceae bacterium]